jgi:CrcB protein
VSGLRAALLVGAGGFVGSVCRWALSGAVHQQLPFAAFPFGTLVVNLVGCLGIGLLGALVDSRQLLGPEVRALLMIGVLGGFTTFSTFGYETLALLREGEQLRALLNVLSHVLLGLAAVWLGYALGLAR